MDEFPRHIDTTHTARWWSPDTASYIRCRLCPRECRIPENGHGRCGARWNHRGRLVLGFWGRISGMNLDPVEKKPLNHFFPGSQVLSFGTVGCTLSCAFCQNHRLSHPESLDVLSDTATPDEIAETAVSYKARSVAFTYNEPGVFAEYALAVAEACHRRGVRAIAVSNGYFQPVPAWDFFHGMDAANIDLKGFTDTFYRERCDGRLQPVLDTLRTIRRRTTCHLEITTLLISGVNDSPSGLASLASWIREELGSDTPLHLTAFHPAWKMRNMDATSPEDLTRARGIAVAAGLRYVYTGNVRDHEGSSTRCHGCGGTVIERDWFTVRRDLLSPAGGRCPFCGTPVPGVFREGNADAPRSSG